MFCLVNIHQCSLCYNILLLSWKVKSLSYIKWLRSRMKMKTNKLYKIKFKLEERKVISIEYKNKNTRISIKCINICFALKFYLFTKLIL
jgi:hypothetical protein